MCLVLIPSAILSSERDNESLCVPGCEMLMTKIDTQDAIKSGSRTTCLPALNFSLDELNDEFHKMAEW